MAASVRESFLFLIVTIIVIARFDVNERIL
jgi:hypothetical protein